MKVLYIVCSGVAGSNVSLKHALGHLQNKKVEAYLLAPNQSTCDFFSSIEIKTFCMSFFPCIWPPKSTIKDVLLFPLRIFYHKVRNIIAQKKIEVLVKTIRPDIIHTNVSVIDLGYKVAHKTKTPHIWHIREYITKDFGYTPIPSFESYCKKLNESHTIVISKDLVRHFKLKDNYRIIYNGILEEEERYISKDKGSYFLYVGRLEDGKGIASLIDAYLSFAEVNMSNTLLYIVGSGTSVYTQYLNNMLSNAKVSDIVKKQVVFLGQRHDVSVLMSEAKCLIVPSISEAFGRITAEAMFNYCLVIGRNTAGTKEQFDNGLELTGREIGFRYNENNELEELLAKVDKGGDFSQMIEDSYFTVTHLYTPSKNAENIYQYYKKIINKL